ncbi:hypothetical protein I8752_18670 [Nostocaceae cyanobacterium CENA369]|uniref:Uncharacterized protein n=1 Tax=Dendronalium phyllosphericum CENA369 TaxID=1725256 RepID=A0A8J7I8B1_9NOST|nr:hypothetical protein [Dendronalium phyllosphericum]MBH8575001.1 hypothetical protein [Dendronalium phyllosphericum CENA369]
MTNECPCLFGETTQKSDCRRFYVAIASANTTDGQSHFLGNTCFNVDKPH